MITIYRTEHDGVIGLIARPDEIDPERSLSEQLIVKIGYSPDGPWLETGDFEPRARLVVLELRNFIREELGI
jgi:hypothetical protein